MNLNRTPTEQQLRDLFASCSDAAGNHLLWVNPDGDVRLTCLPEDRTTGQWFDSLGDEVLFRVETYSRGSGYVGSRAAADADHIQGTLKQLLNMWQDYCEAN